MDKCKLCESEKIETVEFNDIWNGVHTGKVCVTCKCVQ